MIHKRLYIAELIARELANNISSSQLNELNEWKVENARNLAGYSAIKKAILDGEGEKIYYDIDVDSEWKLFYKKHLKPPVFRHPWVSSAHRLAIPMPYAAAAMLLIIISFVLFLNKPDRSSDLYTTIDVPLGSTSHVVLPDGSAVWLNAGTTLSYSSGFNQDMRKVKLTGEAFFEVMNHQLPFIVSIPELNITVLGTRFNVKAYPDDDAIETTLETGKLMIEKATETGQHFDQIVLQPNQKATFFRDRDILTLNQYNDAGRNVSEPIPQQQQGIISQITVRQKRDISPELSWKEGILHVEDEPLSRLVRRLERRYGVTFVFNDAELKDYIYSGTLKEITLEQVMHVLKLTSPINYDIIDQEVFLSVDPETMPKYKRLLIN